MIPTTAAALADLLHATPAPPASGWAVAPDDLVVTGVVTDSREATPGDVYVARVGSTADGADYAPAAVAAGAVATVASRAVPHVPTLVVEDVDAALAAIAADVRTRGHAAVVAVTGSVGKTTTKDLVAAACGASRRVVAARGSFNNEVGVPLTVAGIESDTEVLVAELGARGVGQVAELAAWVRPDVAVVTAVAGVHLELFGTVDAIAATKGELVEALGEDGVAVLNGDDPRVAAMAARCAGRVLTVSGAGDERADLHAAAVVVDDVGCARFVAVTPWGRHEVSLPIAGRHHVGNALAALAVVGALGADVAAGAAALATATVSVGRGRVVRAAGRTILDDSYNANPTSVLAAVDTLAGMRANRRLAVLGVMAEIGADHDAEHRRVGSRAAAVVDGLVVVGDDARGIADGARAAGLDTVLPAADADEAVAVLRTLGPGPGDVVLVKASRVAGLERVVAALAGEEPA